MRDANDLVFISQSLHLSADGVRDFAPDVGVDLIEDKQGNGVLRRQRRFEREHQARDLAARGDGAKRLQWFARIRREEQFNRIKTARPWFFQRREGGFELRLTKTEIAQIATNVVGQFWRSFDAQFSQHLATALQIRLSNVNFSRQSLQLGIASFDLAHAL